MAMNERQKAFCEYYIETLNATESAIKAGYSEKTAYSIGSENLSKPELKEYIEKRLNDAHNKRVASADEILEYFTSVMRGEVKDQLGLETPVKDRNKAGELLAKRHALFIDQTKVTHDGNLGVTIVDDLND